MKNLTILIIIFFNIYQCSADKGSENKNLTNSIGNTSKIQDIDPKFELLIGNWFMPHNADINITFSRDSTFIFNDFNTKLLKDEVLRGKFQLKPDKLILIYNDRPQQIFNFKKGSGIDDNYYITKGKNYYFVKSS